MKLSRKIFYNNHESELSNYLIPGQNALLVTTNFSENKNLLSGLDKCIIDVSNKESFENLQFDNKSFDLIIVSDIFEISDDIYNFLSNLKKILNPNGKILLTSINPKWNFILKFAELIKLKRSTKINSYIHPKKISNIFFSQGFEVIKTYNKQIFPFKLLGIGTILNLFFESILGFFNIGIITYFLYQSKQVNGTNFSKSIIIPAKNEEGNLEELVNRIPVFKESYELIIVCGPSKDNTYQKAVEIRDSYKSLNISVHKQTKNGKANAIWEGINYSNGEAIAILDSDISVDPETLTSFFDILETGMCDFVNGSRLLYSMEDSAMRIINKFGNRGFQFIISKLISLNLSDTLCGTKVFKKDNLHHLYKWQEKMTISDPFCDFDLIFATAK